LKKIKQLFEYLEGSGKTYLLSIISVLLMTVFSTVTPLVIKLTLDSIIGDEPMNLPWCCSQPLMPEAGKPFFRTTSGLSW
jgi:ABC-type multidrug transport system fused ATPase/permease subunit